MARPWQSWALTLGVSVAHMTQQHSIQPQRPLSSLFPRQGQAFSEPPDKGVGERLFHSDWTSRLCSAAAREKSAPAGPRSAQRANACIGTGVGGPGGPQVPVLNGVSGPSTPMGEE